MLPRSWSLVSWLIWMWLISLKLSFSSVVNSPNYVSWCFFSFFHASQFCLDSLYLIFPGKESCSIVSIYPHMEMILFPKEFKCYFYGYLLIILNRSVNQKFNEAYQDTEPKQPQFKVRTTNSTTPGNNFLQSQSFAGKI